MNKPELSVKYFMESATCAQSIMAVYGPEVGLSIEQSLQIGSSLGGGIGYQQHICGAINAGAIIIGLKHGNSVHGDMEKKKRAIKLAGDYVLECQQILGDTQCSELIKIDLNNEAQKEKANTEGLFDRVCNNAVQKCAEILEKYLVEK